MNEVNTTTDISVVAKDMCSDILGKTQAVAVSMIKAAKLQHRILREDSENYFGTSDYKEHRINIELEKDIVVVANQG